MQEPIYSITNNLESFVRFGESNQLKNQLLEVRDREEFKIVMDADFELLSIEYDRKGLKCLLLRLTTRVQL